MTLKGLLMIISCYFLLVESAVNCPLTSISPCICAENGSKPGTIFLLCGNNNLTDDRASEILDVFLTSSRVSPVSVLEMALTLMTRVPDQIQQFTQVTGIDLNFNNIATVEAGSFNFTDGVNNLQFLNMANMNLETIAPATFKGNGYGGDRTIIDLEFNKLTRFEATVFQSVLEQMEPFGGVPNSYISLNFNQFNCSDCHLAWLIRDSRHLIPTVYHATCSNGTFFEELDPNEFSNCPSFMCPLGYDGFYADPLNCSKFYLCSRNNAISYNCPADLEFNPVTSQCDKQTKFPNCNQKL